MSDAALQRHADRLAAMAGLSAPPSARRMGTVEYERLRRRAGARAGLSDVYGAYHPHTHTILVAPGRRGVALLHTLAHEIVHCVQQARLGVGAEGWRALYWQSVQRNGYTQCPYEIAAQEYGAALVAAYAAELEEQDDA